MDVTAARTFLAIAETGSFKAAADRLYVTQSAVSMRIKALEDALGRQLFTRSKKGAELTAAGEQFLRHASALLRVWQHAQLEVSLSEEHTDHLMVGAQVSLWEGFLLDWVAWMRRTHPRVAITASLGNSHALIQGVQEGNIDIAVAYRATARPGVEVEHLVDDELILVSSGEKGRERNRDNYVFVNWGPEFAADHAEAYPELNVTGLHLDLGAIGLNYLLNYEASGYFPRRIVQPFIEEGRMVEVTDARKFVYPVFAAYPEERDSLVLDPILDWLRKHAASTLAR